jgi:hypothetical protein
VTVWDANGCRSFGDLPASIRIVATDVRCGLDLNKIILCHVPPGNAGNPQTICVGPSAVSWHLANHPDDCIGPCSLYYAPRYSSISNAINEAGFYSEAYPNPFNHGFALHLIADPDETIRVSILDMTGRIVEAYNDVTEHTEIGTKLSAGIYFVETIQGNNMQRHRIVKQ